MQEASVSAQTNKAIVNRFFHEGLAAGDLGVFEEILAPDCTYHDAGRPAIENRADFIGYVGRARAPLSRTDVMIHDLVAEGDRVAARCTYSLENEEGQFDLAVMGIFRFGGDKIVQIWRNVVLLAA
jgi:limonene-1,2-epoxide hydrolase